MLSTSVLQFALLQWQNELNKDQEKNVSLQNRRLQPHRARGRHGTEIKILGDLLLQMIDQGNLIDSPSRLFKIGL